MDVFTKSLFLLVPRNFFTRMLLVLFLLRENRPIVYLGVVIVSNGEDSITFKAPIMILSDTG